MNSTQLKTIWLENTRGCRGKESEWSAIETAYTSPGRHYHTLGHISEVYEALASYYGERIPAPTILALFYHDLVYSPLRRDNEKQSAVYAFKKISASDIAPPVAAKTRDIILATAAHQSQDEETRLFLDADMAILGSNENRYKEYADQVRKEFGIYPDLIYRRGRRRFIEDTLKRNSIYLTDAFKKKYETQARRNLLNELKTLS